MNCFVISRIDYCNSLLAGCPQYSLDRLQRVMNAAARMLCGAGSRAHVSHLLHKLHWLRVSQRIEYKLCLLVYKALHGLAPCYLTELCHTLTDDPGRKYLRSAAHGDLDYPDTNTKFGDRAFAVAGPRAWNNLPPHIRSTSSIDLFKIKLKTVLFSN